MRPLKLSTVQEAELLRLQQFYHNEVGRCRRVKAYLAACIMAGSELEASLILMVNIYQKEARATGVAPRREANIKPLLEWKLVELLRVAKAARWLPSQLQYGVDDWDDERAQAGDYAEVVREMRNFVHPSAYMEDHFKKRVTRQHLNWILNAVDAANSWLLARIEKSLVQRMATGQGGIAAARRTRKIRRTGESGAE